MAERTAPVVRDGDTVVHVARALEAAVDRALSTRADVGDDWPYYADPATGRWHTTEDGDWCDGHWIEMLRLTGELTGRDDLVTEAAARTERVRWKLEKDDQFRGHRFYYSAARLHEHTGDPRMRTLALAGAYAMRSMAMRANGAMPIGTEVQVKSTRLASRQIVAVDNLHPNLRLDWWAWRQTGDDVFVEGPRRMAEVIERHFLRPDGSTIEFIEFDPDLGVPLRHFTLLGHHDDSCWSRGQAWAIAGCLLGYETTRDVYYADLLRPLFDYWWERTGPAPPPWDFDDPDPDAPRDTSAAAIVVSAMARLAVDEQGPGAVGHMLGRLPAMLRGLLEHVTPVGPDDQRPPGMLLDGCFNHPRSVGARHETLWGDFYLLDALATLHRGRAIA